MQLSLAFLKLLLELASLTAKYMHDKQLIEAGAAQEILKNLYEADNKINIAKRALANVDSIPVDTDPYNRDNLV